MSLSIPEARQLPRKLKEILGTLHMLYEKREYNNGIAAADQILDKYPNHGETLAMKGLHVHSKGDKEEGYRLVKLGVKNDIQSSTCWHVFGLIYRNDNNTKEASKCYLNSLRLDSTNQIVLRDLSYLQIQMRDYPGFAESRRKILNSRPSLRANWVAYMAASAFAGNFDTAVQIIQQFTSMYPSDPHSFYEDSEMILFQISCLERLAKYQEAVTQLDTSESRIVDKHFLVTKRAELLVILGRFDEAVVAWVAIVKEHGENYHFHAAFQTALLGLDRDTALAMLSLKHLRLPCNTLFLTPEQKQCLLSAYQEHGIKSKATDKILLELLEGPALLEALRKFIRRRIIDGVPSLFQDIKALCLIANPVDPESKVYAKDPFDFRAHPIALSADAICDEFLAELEAPDCPESAMTTLWALYFKCSLLEIQGRFAEALVVVEKCIRHTPTAPDMVAKKARLLKKCGDYEGAAAIMEACRQLDLQDRYLNNKATKYFLRANQVERAMDTIALFIKDKEDGDPQSTLFTLQCNWYENAAGDAYARRGEWGPALRKYTATEKHFTDYSDDLFDFHQFCIRKATLRSYEEVLHMVDTAFTHKYFQRAARGAITVYLKMIDAPPSTATAVVSVVAEAPAVARVVELPEEASLLSAAEQKKLREKLRKQQKKKEKKEKQVEEPEEESVEVSEEERKAAVVKAAEDAAVTALLAKNPTEEMVRLAAELVRFPTAEPVSQAIAFEVYWRRKKYSLAVRCLVCGLAAERFHPELTVQLVKMSLLNLQEVGEAVRETIAESLGNLLQGKTTAVFVTDFVALVKSLSLPHRTAAARCLALLDRSLESRRAAAMLISDDEVWAGRGISIENVLSAHRVLVEDLRVEDVAEAFREKCAVVFPLSNALGSGLKIDFDLEIPYMAPDGSENSISEGA